MTTQAAATIRISAIIFRSLSFRELGAREAEDRNLDYGGEGGIRTHGTVSRTLAFEASTLNHSVTSPGWLQLPS